jgi:hypothetical protein
MRSSLLEQLEDLLCQSGFLGGDEGHSLGTLRITSKRGEDVLQVQL